MDSLLAIVDTADPSEPDNVAELRKEAKDILTSATTSPNQSQIPETNHSLLTTILKPLFSKSQHLDLTATGRKNQLTNQPTIPVRFGHDSIFSPPPLWKTSWTVPLLSHILTTYTSLSESTRKPTLESHFHLLVPPILHLIDDTSIPWKADGCKCLTQLCILLIDVDSTMLKRTGLTEVFIDALRTCFHHLPTLTPEDESLLLLDALYPAYLAVVRARFVTLYHTSRKENLSPAQVTAEHSQRDKLLTVLLRHSLIHALEHLDVGSPGTSSVALCVFLLGQISPVFQAMGVAACAHLKVVMPLLVRVLCEPFSVAVPAVIEGAVAALQACVEVCWVRFRDTEWWVECLGGVVEGWSNVKDELEGPVDGQRRVALEGVIVRMRVLVMLLEDVVGQEKFGAVKSKLMAEEWDLREVFDSRVTTDAKTGAKKLG